MPLDGLLLTLCHHLTLPHPPPHPLSPPAPPSRNKDVPVNHRDFWYATYTLYSVSEAVESEERLSDAASGSSGGCAAGEQGGGGGRQLTMVSFLKPVLKQIIMAGKSMQLLKNLDCKEAERPEGFSRGRLVSRCYCVAEKGAFDSAVLYELTELVMTQNRHARSGSVKQPVLCSTGGV